MFPSKTVYPSSTVASLRVPPNSPEAEASVLGSILIKNLSFDEISESINESDFYSPKNSLVFGAIKTLIMSRNPADVVTVNAYLEKTGQATDVGGIAYLNQLAHSVPSAASIRSYSQIVLDRSVRRSLIAAGDGISAQAYASTESIEDLQSDAEQKLSQARSNGTAVSPLGGMHDLMDDMLDQLMDKLDNPGQHSGVRTGFSAVDNLTGGLQPGQLVVIAARPSMGKTALALNIAEHAALDQKLPTLIISLEMSAGQLIKRVVSSVGKFDQSAMRDGTISQTEFQRMLSSEKVKRIKQSQLEIVDSGVSTISSIRRCARQAIKKHGGLGLVVVDYLQLLASDSGSSENRTTEISDISRGLKLLAGELGCPVIALSQLNRNVEQRVDKRPMMSDLRESGSIEQDADIIMFIYRDDYYAKEDSKCPGVAEIIIAKQRNGAVGTVNLAWTPEHTRFDNID